MRTALESSCQGHIPETKDLMGHWVTPTPRLKEDEARTPAGGGGRVSAGRGTRLERRGDHRHRVVRFLALRPPGRRSRKLGGRVLTIVNRSD